MTIPKNTANTMLYKDSESSLIWVPESRKNSTHEENEKFHKEKIWHLPLQFQPNNSHDQHNHPWTNNLYLDTTTKLQLKISIALVTVIFSTHSYKWNKQINKD